MCGDVGEEHQACLKRQGILNRSREFWLLVSISLPKRYVISTIIPNQTKSSTADVPSSAERSRSERDRLETIRVGDTGAQRH